MRQERLSDDEASNLPTRELMTCVCILDRDMLEALSRVACGRILYKVGLLSVEGSLVNSEITVQSANPREWESRPKLRYISRKMYEDLRYLRDIQLQQETPFNCEFFWVSMMVWPSLGDDYHKIKPCQLLQDGPY